MSRPCGFLAPGGLLETWAERGPPYGVFTRVETNKVMELRSVRSRFPFVTTDTLEPVAGRYALHLP